MNQDYIIPDPWNIIEEGLDSDHVKASESIFSMGNGAMGQRANFEEHYSGPTFQGSYIGGVYYPDKTKVGWWKNGYPEYFAKVLNAPSWIGIDVHINGERLDLNACREVKEFKRVFNMKEGYYERTFQAVLANEIEIKVIATRFLSLDEDEAGAIRYSITPINTKATISLTPYVDSGIKNEDANWDEKFWETLDVKQDGDSAFIVARTLKTHFYVCTFMQARCLLNGQNLNLSRKVQRSSTYLGHTYQIDVSQGDILTMEKYGGYATSMNHDKYHLISAAKNTLEKVGSLGFDTLKKMQKTAWSNIWEMADITIDGDVKAQQGIRFNIVQLNHTYLGKDPRLNIGPKGFTGEKYGGSTYWDTEAYCIPFYMATKDQQVARNLLKYRYEHLPKAIENAEKLGFIDGAALYPMVTMNGEECHNEWEITFEEIHRNGAIVFAIYNYVRYTGDYSYIPEMGLEVMIAVARFWKQRATFSTHKKKYVILGVTGPNEYENNVNNNFYTNYIARWCIQFAQEHITKVREEYPQNYHRIVEKTGVSEDEVSKWMEVASNMYFPYSEEHEVYLQQDGFLDKELVTVDHLDKATRPINQHWSWDRILRSPYIKQADTLQGFYFFENDFTEEELERHFDFYGPFTVHESSLSPCVHSIQAAKLGRMEQAYTFYLRTSRLDLDDYNKEVHEGLHITSMAGTWMSIVEGFGGMRVKDGVLTFSPKIPKEWQAYSFKVNFRHQILKVMVSPSETTFDLEGDEELTIKVNGKTLVLSPQRSVTSS